MAMRGWKAGVTLGLLGIAGLLAGCSDRKDAELRQDARQVGREVGKAARNVGEATQEAVEGFKEGVGGSGTERDDATIGDKKGVINDGEGPFEQPAKPGEKKTVLNDGKGPLE